MRTLKRILAVLGAVALMAALGVWWAAPKPAGAWCGDPGVVAAVGDTAGLNEAVAVLVERGRPARYALLGADEHRPFEIGSNSKTMLGLLLADAVARGEVALDDPLGRRLPELAGTPVAGATLRELATHTSGLPRDGAHFEFGVCWVVGTNCLGAGADALTADLRAAGTPTRGTASYSNLGAAALGLAVARAAGTDYAGLLQSRLFGPLAMTETRLQTPATGPLAPRGFQPWGLRPESGVMDAYAPAGAVVSTGADMGRYLEAILAGTAPGSAALEPLVAVPGAPAVGAITDNRLGLLWFAGRLEGRDVLQHTGQTAGYRSALVVDRAAGRAAIVLANVDTPVGARAQAVLLRG